MPRPASARVAPDPTTHRAGAFQSSFFETRSSRFNAKMLEHERAVGSSRGGMQLSSPREWVHRVRSDAQPDAYMEWVTRPHAHNLGMPGYSVRRHPLQDHPRGAPTAGDGSRAAPFTWDPHYGAQQQQQRPSSARGASRGGAGAHLVKDVAGAASAAVNARFSNMFKAFQSVDLDRSGTLDRDEIRRALKLWGMGDEIDDRTLDSLLAACDADGDGHIVYTEFVDALVRVTPRLNALAPRTMLRN